MSQKRVVLFKKKDEEDKYCQSFVEHGFIPEFIPVLDHRLENLETIGSVLLNGTKEFSALVLTSQRSTEALDQAYHLIRSQLNQQIREEWNSIPIYIVGPHTADALGQTSLFRGHSHPHWVVASRAAELIKPLVHLNSTVLFLAGDKRRDIIPEALNAAHISFREIKSYATCVHPKLANRLQPLFTGHSPLSFDWAVYFSPSGLKFIQSVLDPFSFERLLKEVKVAAIGPTTAEYIQEDLGLTVHAMADHPNAKDLLDAIQNYQE